MTRWFVTGFIAAVAGTLSWLRRGSPLREGADAAYELGIITAVTLWPFFPAVLVAGLIGLFVTGTPGSFHRRLNWVALAVLVLTTLGRFASKAA